MCECAKQMRDALHARRMENPKADVEKPRLCPEKADRVHTMCRKCTEVISLDFGALTESEAVAKMKDIDTPRECPGYHVELGNWEYFWQLPAAVKARFNQAGAVASDIPLLLMIVFIIIVVAGCSIHFAGKADQAVTRWEEIVFSGRR